ncbi:MAG: hypothetical protein QOK04_2808, partial [Solirubrobacteraceae bacterium]|nr:hypothetical protein [Solirubrobacteraceae bacterium]
MGLPRETVVAWSRGLVPAAAARLLAGEPALPQCQRCGATNHGEPPGAAYAFLLGAYLGDGCLGKSGRTTVLAIACDAKYPGVIEACQRAISKVIPGKRSGLVRYRNQALVVIRSYANAWLCLFPQHGPGRKHARPIRLD